MGSTTRAVTDRQHRSTLTWEEPACLLCGGRDRDTILEAQDADSRVGGLWFAVVRCRRCGLRFTSPRPDENAIADFYPIDYAPHRPKGPPRPTSAPLAWLRGRPCIERRTLAPHGQCRLLDFGCGSGDYLERMQAQGWRVTGIDSSIAAVASAERRLGVRVLCGTLPHGGLTPGSFDVITMWQSLEHVHDPLSVLRAARELLAPDGKLLVSVPNIAGLPFQWFGSAWSSLDVPRHLTHFCPDSLKDMLQKAGFGEVRIRQLRHDDWLRASAKLAAQRPNGHWWHRILSHRPMARCAAWMCYALRRSDCMLATASV